MDIASFDKASSAGFLANMMARLFENRLAAAIRPLGLTPAQFMTLLELWAEEGQTQAALVARLAVEQATMAGTLGRMERDGLIERRPHPSDKRAQTLHLTERARALEALATEAAQAVNARALAGLTPEEQALFLDLMARVIGRLGK
ncbi:MarR family winged helix-turn-helix transcriptional regulator [Rhodobacter maris]|uniref:DNA-binding MarR family transcriptional regulator n=1 Tax=Rhodobacter maris TaxID=446682 RepID=A0A285SCK2_9RHOB|nr:MarR family transcriptional regulator [Rhodobacter maris]SOC05089.1 DNA-binding MarR family transcriptional regulator [Rhodobacter maris]